jgi:hypothetical protein
MKSEKTHRVALDDDFVGFVREVKETLQRGEVSMGVGRERSDGRRERRTSVYAYPTSLSWQHSSRSSHRSSQWQNGKPSGFDNGVADSLFTARLSSELRPSHKGKERDARINLDGEGRRWMIFVLEVRKRAAVQRRRNLLVVHVVDECDPRRTIATLCKRGPISLRLQTPARSSVSAVAKEDKRNVIGEKWQDSICT